MCRLHAELYAGQYGHWYDPHTSHTSKSAKGVELIITISKCSVVRIEGKILKEVHIASISRFLFLSFKCLNFIMQLYFS